MISIRLPFIDQLNSSAAIRAASREPGPDAEESGPFISAITPILTKFSPPREGAAQVIPAATARARQLIRTARDFTMASSYSVFATRTRDLASFRGASASL